MVSNIGLDCPRAPMYREQSEHLQEAIRTYLGRGWSSAGILQIGDDRGLTHRYAQQVLLRNLENNWYNMLDLRGGSYTIPAPLLLLFGLVIGLVAGPILMPSILETAASVPSYVLIPILILGFVAWSRSGHGAHTGVVWETLSVAELERALSLEDMRTHTNAVVVCARRKKFWDATVTVLAVSACPEGDSLNSLFYYEHIEHTY